MNLHRLARALDHSITSIARALRGTEDAPHAPHPRPELDLPKPRRNGLVGAIGLVMPTTQGQFDDPYFLRMLGYLGPCLGALGFDLLVTAAPQGDAECATYRHLVEARRVDGLFLFRTRLRDARVEYLLDSGMPFVAHGRAISSRPFAYVDGDSTTAMRRGTERLIGFGHRRIAMINATKTYSFAHHREIGWRRALQAAGLPDHLVTHGEPTEPNGYRLAEMLLNRPAPPTAIVCATDRLAVGAFHAVSAAGLRVGHDVSIIGYDNLPIACYTDPPLTSWELPLDDVAGRIVDMLLALIQGADPADMAVLLPPRLIARSSDGPAPAEDPANLRGRSRFPRSSWR